MTINILAIGDVVGQTGLAFLKEHLKPLQKLKGVSFTVVNHHALIQTGQLNWPIPLLVCAGALLIALGVILLSKKRKTDA